MEGQFVTYGTPRGEASLEDVEAAIDAEVERIRAEGITEAELDAAKNRVRNALIYQRDSQTSLARRYGVALTTGRSVEDVESWPDRIEAVTVEAVNAAARTVLTDASVTGYLLPAERTEDAPAAEIAPDATNAAVPPAAPTTDTGAAPASPAVVDDADEES